MPATEVSGGKERKDSKARQESFHEPHSVCAYTQRSAWGEKAFDFAGAYPMLLMPSRDLSHVQL